MQDFFNATYEKYLSNYLHPLTSKTLCGWVQSMKLKSHTCSLKLDVKKDCKMNLILYVKRSNYARYLLLSSLLTTPFVNENSFLLEEKSVE